MAINLKIKDDKNKFLPGNEIQGEVMFRLSCTPAKIVVILYWFTDGTVSNIMQELEFYPVDSFGVLPFKFKLPITPYSYSGKLFSISWEIEAYSVSPEERCAWPFIMSPYDTEGELRTRVPIYNNYPKNCGS
jgi:hypothetical protein